MTYNQALKLQYRDELHHNTRKNSDGTCQRWRVNGKVKTWKRDAERIEIPVKHGLYSCDTLTGPYLAEMHLSSECTHRLDE